MKTTTFAHTQKRTKRTVIIHDIPIKRTLPDGTELMSMPVAEQVDNLLRRALALEVPRIEMWFVAKTEPKKQDHFENIKAGILEAVAISEGRAKGARVSIRSLESTSETTKNPNSSKTKKKEAK